MNKATYGAIIGDMVGSIYERNPIRTKDFPFFSRDSHFTDDTVMTMAVAEWLITDTNRTQTSLEECMVRWGYLYPRAGYGDSFSRWLFNKTGRKPYNSWGNGSAMRCSACGWVAETLNEDDNN